MRDFLHKLFGCSSFSVVGWSIMGNPIEVCTHCGQLYVTYGSINARRKPITQKQAEDIREVANG